MLAPTGLCVAARLVADCGQSRTPVPTGLYVATLLVADADRRGRRSLRLAGYHIVGRGRRPRRPVDVASKNNTTTTKKHLLPPVYPNEYARREDGASRRRPLPVGGLPCCWSRMRTSNARPYGLGGYALAFLREEGGTRSVTEGARVALAWRFFRTVGAYFQGAGGKRKRVGAHFAPTLFSPRVALCLRALRSSTRFLEGCGEGF